MRSFMLAFIFVVTSSVCDQAYGQSEGFDASGSGYLDSITEDDKPQPELDVDGHMRFLSIVPAAGGEEKRSFWGDPVLYETYTYSRKDSASAEDNETDSNDLNSEIYIENANEFSVIGGFRYTRRDAEDNLGTESSGNKYTLSLSPAQEVLHLITGSTDKDRKITIGAQLGYRHDDGEKRSAVLKNSTESDSFLFSPSVTASQVLGKAKAIVIAAYNMDATGNEDSGDHYGTSAGVFSLLGRGEYKITDLATALLWVQWKRDVHQDLGPGRSAVDDDWAEFGGQVRYKLSEAVRVRAGYAYETFRLGYDVHKATLRFELTL